MNRDQLWGLLTVTQTNDYTWTARLPELPSMWAKGYSEDEAKEKWLQDYDQPVLYSVFASVLQERAEHPRITEETVPTQRIDRPATIDFPYRGHLYRIATNEGPPKRHIVLPSGTILVVCQWVGRVPACLADIRRDPEPMPPSLIAASLDGVEALELPLPLGQTTQAMAILDYEGQRYALEGNMHACIEFPDGRLFRVQSTYLEEPVRIAKITPVDRTDASTHSRNTSSTTRAQPVALDYPGMAHAPRDLRIRFSYHGRQYILSHEAYEQRKGIVYLPDEGFFRIGTYLESMPVQLGGLQPLSASPASMDHVAVALLRIEAVDTDE